MTKIKDGRGWLMIGLVVLIALIVFLVVIRIDQLFIPGGVMP